MVPDHNSELRSAPCACRCSRCMPDPLANEEVSMNENPFVERVFELDGGELIVRFYAPSREPGGEFKCRLSIGWPEREVRTYLCGEDGVQALMLAMRYVHGMLVES